MHRQAFATGPAVADQFQKRLNIRVQRHHNNLQPVGPRARPVSQMGSDSAERYPFNELDQHFFNPGEALFITGNLEMPAVDQLAAEIRLPQLRRQLHGFVVTAGGPPTGRCNPQCAATIQLQ
ncbi:hypothetical protein D3C80_1703380 [compost metagenome]